MLKLSISKFQIVFLHILNMQVSAILSDYDGTLSPTINLTSSSKTRTLANSRIQTELDRTLWEISSKRIIAIVSTKDFNFLHDRTRFADILSCMMSIETIILKHIDSEPSYKNKRVQKSILNVDVEILRGNYQKLESVIDAISLKFKDVTIYRKLTYKRNLLSGVSVDWRQLGDWNSTRNEIEELILRMSNKVDNTSEYPLFVQTYSSHPFVDLYSTVCSKGIAYDNLKKIIHDSCNRAADKKILYLGDSENDNPAFRKADVSIGVKSDERLNPKLECQYLINFSQLPKFLMRLLKNDFNFSEKLL
ncbi:MAG: hypothetical protein ACP5OH_00595 [Nitrososphaerota archaeon]